MLAEYAKNPGQNWKHKDAAIYLVTSLASKGQTQKVGTTESLTLSPRSQGSDYISPATVRNNTSQSAGESQRILREPHPHRPEVAQR